MGEEDPGGNFPVILENEALFPWITGEFLLPAEEKNIHENTVLCSANMLLKVQKQTLLEGVAFDEWVRISLHFGPTLQVNCPILHSTGPTPPLAHP
jgi:hypothetical protein